MGVAKVNLTGHEGRLHRLFHGLLGMEASGGKLGVGVRAENGKGLVVAFG